MLAAQVDDRIDIRLESQMTKRTAFSDSDIAIDVTSVATLRPMEGISRLLLHEQLCSGTPAANQELRLWAENAGTTRCLSCCVSLTLDGM